MSKKSKDSWVRTIDVSNPVLHKKGYTLYKVTSKVFPKNSVEAVTEVTVWKRFNDFKKLHKALSTLHQNLYLKDPFPPFAKTHFFGRFDPQVIEERRLSALQLLQFASSCSPLFTSQVFVKFFEDGHFVEECKSIGEHGKENNANILQPHRCPITSDTVYKPLNSKKENNTSPENGRSETFSPLGGIWQHHQVPDNISLGSHGTDDDNNDDDDNTTFTDDDSITSRPSLNLSEFDPLLQGNFDKNKSDQEALCNSWLLSALQSCNGVDRERDLENILDFPKPFGECEISEDSVPSSNDSQTTKEGHFTFDLPTTPTAAKFDGSEFDPLAVKDISSNEESVYNCDEFAMTPDYCKRGAAERPPYIVDASGHVKNAQCAEENRQYKAAFDFYKTAIDLLLHGFQKESCPDTKESVRKKLYLYLMKAEELYETKLPKTDNTEKPNRVQICPTVPAPTTGMGTNLQGSAHELDNYKVLGVLDKVLLVLDAPTNNIYIVKTLYKSPNPHASPAAQIVPQNVPYVVRLHRMYETSYALFFILEHATGGRLWDYVSSFLQRSPLSPCNDGTCLYIEPRTKVDLCNIYSGKKICDGKNNDDLDPAKSVDPDLTPSENCPLSYIDLFKKYADSMDKKESVSLAKYHKLNNPSSKSKLSWAGEKNHNSINAKIKLLQPPKTSTNRLSSSTGSLETTFTQKASNLDAICALEQAVSQAPSKAHIPDECVIIWAAEIVTALELLHRLGIVWMDLHPNNILLGTGGHILLTYPSQWSNVDFVVNKRAKENFFTAPEVGGIFPVTPDCDWWSLGAILFELLTSQSLRACHPTGITKHTVLNFPTDMSSDAKDFISKLLQYNPGERLGSGIYGIEEIKSHPFFHGINWEHMPS